MSASQATSLSSRPGASATPPPQGRPGGTVAQPTSQKQTVIMQGKTVTVMSQNARPGTAGQTIRPGTTIQLVRQVAPGSIRQIAPGSIRAVTSGSIRPAAPGSIRQVVPGSIRQVVPGSIRPVTPGSIRQVTAGNIRPVAPSNSRHVVITGQQRTSGVSTITRPSPMGMPAKQTAISGQTKTVIVSKPTGTSTQPKPATPSSSSAASTSGAAASSSSQSSSSTSVFAVKMRQNTAKNNCIMKFAGPAVDFAKVDRVDMQRENNFRNFKLAHDMDTMPQYGAGSEFGRKQKEEARRKKYGMATRKYDPYAQPWLMTAGQGKKARKLKGTREGAVNENTAYYMFTQLPTGAFEAVPIAEWYSFNSTIKYKYLNSEEAEEEFSRRDKNLNLRSIMLKKRLKGEEGLDEEEQAELLGRAVKKPKSKSSGLKLTEMEDWMDSDEEDSADGSDDEEKTKKDKKPKDAKKKRKQGKLNSDDEAVEESDDADEGAEVVYMTSSDSEEEMMFDGDKQRDQDKYEEQGVAEESGLRTMIDSDEEDEDEEKKDDEDDEDDEDKKEKKKDSDSDDSDEIGSDIDDDPALALIAAAVVKKDGDDKASEGSAEGSAATNSRSATPSVEVKKEEAGGDAGASTAGVKRSATDSPVPKKARFDYHTSMSGEVTDDAVRRYLMRKPHTTTDLVLKFNSKKGSLTKEQLVNKIAEILKRLKPDSTKVKNKLYLSIKK